MAHVGPFQDDPSSRWTCRGIQHNLYWPTSTWAWRSFPNKFSMNFLGEQHTKCCQDGHRFSPETSLSSQWRYPNSWGFKQNTRLWCPVIGILGTGGRAKVGSFDMFLRSDFLIRPFHHSSSLCVLLSTLVGYLTTQTNCWVAQWDNWLWCQHSHNEPYACHTTQLGPSQKPSHIISDSVDLIG